MEGLKGKIIIITGGGSGLGQETALRLAKEGARLVLVDLNPEGMEETRGKIAAQYPDAEVLAIEANVSSDADVKRYVDETMSRFGRIDGFFNNAGIEGKQNLTADYGTDEFDKVIGVNLNGVFYGLKHVLPIMRQQGSGSVVNTASVGGIRGVGHQSGYAASKHGVVGLTRNSGVEYAEFGVRVNAIAPGAIMTPMVENSLRQLDPDDPMGAGEAFVSANPAKRFGRPEEVSGVVAFLFSDEATFINAAVITIDGGQSYKY
ncbi:MAG TPA: glucose 1-dehydrogenase [Candidatus Limnocylindria bacterium]|nr:glucose 1-dehydrogenase [Candidatus Limnocylindria bacterium]